MKNLFKKIIITLIIFSQLLPLVTFANSVSVLVTEKIPWIPCSKVDWTYDSTTWWYMYSNSDWQTSWVRGGDKQYEVAIMYDCKVSRWTYAIIQMLWSILKYFTYIASLVWVLFIVYNWILYSMSWIDEWMKKESKDRIVWTLIWLLILFLAWPLLKILAPWVYA